MHKRLTLFLAILCLFQSACLRPPRAYQTPNSPYGEALEASTQTLSLYRRFDESLIAYATLETPNYIQYRRRELASVYHLDESRIDEKISVFKEDSSKTNIILSLYTRSRDWNNLDQPNAAWQLSFRQGSHTLTPEKIVRIQRDMPGILLLYPYLDPFFVAYRVTFSQPLAQAPCSLEIAGPGGVGVMNFP